jgi:hypothetical protein
MPPFARTPLTALIAFACGLCLAGGVATAASKAHGSAKACVSKKGALSLLHHAKCPKGSHHVTLGAKGPRGLPGPRGTAGAAAVKYWADVSETGALLHASPGVTSVELVDTTAGRHNPYALVTFPADVTGCAPEATLGLNSNNTLTVGEITAFPEHALDPTNTNQELVQAHEDGTPDGTTIAAAFSLTVTC